ncbi:hypothetical protein TNIN_417311 [Trichonephila inaurata madagascariensis]|uniref:Uncharacterized protein n=1 Tax=Trichonephila inaurata madagascariensis TaxID=2747483 RepID=A0A8X7BYU1_9ARAC|nr:hypothetical protein TNIN_417311 [Trichonephila inaurata madagascariensis]
MKTTVKIENRKRGVLGSSSRHLLEICGDHRRISAARVSSILLQFLPLLTWKEIQNKNKNNKKNVSSPQRDTNFFRGLEMELRKQRRRQQNLAVGSSIGQKFHFVRFSSGVGKGIFPRSPPSRKSGKTF